ncbi:MAG: hypothetical protein HY064_01305 [Bacteroidetes bacterium]|nr:hypothetical protein [Bacteroidota bacterium]
MRNKFILTSLVTLFTFLAGGNFSAQSLLIKKTYVKPADYQQWWEAAFSYENEYDSLGRKTTETTKKQDPKTGAWIQFAIDNYSYNSTGKQSLKIHYRDYNGTTGMIPEGRLENFYNRNGFLSESTYSLWDKDTQSWKKDYSDFYLVDSSGTILCDTMKVWYSDKSEWEDRQYTKTGKGLGKTFNPWDPKTTYKWENNGWTAVEKITTTFDSASNSITVHESDLNYGGIGWHDEGFTTRYYDPKGRVEKLVCGIYPDSSIALYGNETRKYYYDEYGDNIRIEKFTWNRKTNQVDDLGTEIMVYKHLAKPKQNVLTKNDTAKGTQMLLADNDILLSLSPKKDSLKITRTGNANTESTITIFDARGNMIASFGMKGTEMTISVAELRAGFYNLSLENVDDNIFVLKNLAIER